jgi:type I restriction enzyme, S subunit
MTNWQTTCLGELLSRSTETAKIQPDESYKEITVKLWGKGVVLRGVVSGSQLNGSRRFVARRGQLILSRIDARNGAIGMVPDSLDGSVVSTDFPLFAIERNRIQPSYFEWLTKTKPFVELCQKASEGTTNRVRLQEDQFLNLQISLPTLPEQRRIVARIKELAAKINEARGLRQRAAEEAGAFVASVSNELFSEENMRCWPTRSFEEIAEIRSGVTLGRTLRGKTIRLPYLRVANVQDGHLVLNEIKEIDVLEAEAAKWKLIAGDLLLTEGGDWDKLGRGTIWRDEIPNCIHQNHIFRVRTRADEFIPEFLAALVASPVGKAYFQDASKQTTNLASINQRQLKAFRVFQPSLTDQRRIVAELNDLQAQAGALKKLQTETAAELDALLPSILDRAFKGEL